MANKFKVGDRVICIPHRIGTMFSVDTVYTVVGLDGDDHVLLAGKLGSYESGRFELAQPDLHSLVATKRKELLALTAQRDAQMLDEAKAAGFVVGAKVTHGKAKHTISSLFVIDADYTEPMSHLCYDESRRTGKAFVAIRDGNASMPLSECTPYSELIIQGRSVEKVKGNAIVRWGSHTICVALLKLVRDSAVDVGVTQLDGLVLHKAVSLSLIDICKILDYIKE